jgi:hypothetical protein
VPSPPPCLPLHPQSQSHRGGTCHTYCPVNWSGSARGRTEDIIHDVPTSVFVHHKEVTWAHCLTYSVSPIHTTWFSKGCILFPVLLLKNTHPWKGVMSRLEN